MNKKFLSAILFGALAVASTGSFVSCKDYDDDIDNLQTQINGLASAKDLSDKVSALQSAISSAQTAAEAKAAAAQVVADAAKTAAEKAGADAKAANDAAAAAADAAAKALDAAVEVLTKDINDVKGAQAAAEEACKKSLEALQASVDKAATKDELKAAEAAVAAVAEGLEKNINDVKVSVEELAKTVAEKADKKDLEAVKKDLAAAKEEALAAAADAKAAAEQVGKDAAAALKASEAKLNEAVAAADAAAKKAQETADKANAAVAELEKTAATKEELAAVAAAAKKAQDAADAAKEDAAAAAAAAKKAQDAADKNAAAIAAQAKAIEAAATKEAVAGLDTRVKALEAAMEKLAGEDGVKALAKLAEDLGGDVENIQAQLGVISKRLTSLVFAPTTYINGIEAITFNSLNYVDWGKNPKNWLRNTASAAKLNADNSLVLFTADSKEAAKKAGALVGADGEPIKIGGKYVAAADFFIIGDENATAEYMVSPSAGVNDNSVKNYKLLLNKATNTRAEEVVSIVDGSAHIEDGKLTLKLKKNVNDVLGGAITGHLGLIDGSVTVDGNTGSLDNPLVYLPTQTENFWIAALQATLAEDVLTDAEKEADADVNVTSDWVRLAEHIDYPFIANKLIRLQNGKIDCSVATETKSSHFWGYVQDLDNFGLYHGTLSEQQIKDGKELYDLVEKDPDNIEKNYIAKEAVYTGELDLLSIVTVCNREGVEIPNYADFGLYYEFNPMHYIVSNKTDVNQMGEADDTTDQYLFQTLEDGHILIPTSRKGDKFNADAEGRTPVIQAVLRDSKNDNAVVDVRYFKIKWVDKAVESKVAEIATGTVDGFNCDLYESYIKEKYMNDLYASMGENGMTKTEFHATYPNVYEVIVENDEYSFFAYSYYDAEKKATVTYTADEIMAMMAEKTDKNIAELKKLAIGKASEVVDGAGSAQTYNYLITVDATKVNPEDEADFLVEGVFALVSTSNQVVIPVKFDVKEGAYKYFYGYDEPMWNGTLSEKNADKVRPINPSLITDDVLGGTFNGTVYSHYFTTQLIGDLTRGYREDGKNPDDYLALVKYYDYQNKDKANGVGEDAPTNIVFDADRLAELPSLDDLTEYNADGSVATAYGWAIHDNGKILYYSDIVDYGTKDQHVRAYSANTAVVGAKISTAGVTDDPVAGAKYVYLVDNTTLPMAVKKASTAGVLFEHGTNDPTDAALRLVGNSVPVKVTADNSCKPVVFDRYLVKFIKPLEISTPTSNVTLKDILNGGDVKSFTIADQINVKEAFGSRTSIQITAKPATYWLDTESDYQEWVAIQKKNNETDLAKSTYQATMLGEEKTAEVPASDLAKWYGINSVGIDPENLLINLTKDGKILSENTPVSKYSLMSEIKSGDKQSFELIFMSDDDAWDATTQTPAEITGVMYHNKSGNPITKDLKILVPVSFDTKWQQGISEYITIVVKPNL